MKISVTLASSSVVLGGSVRLSGSISPSLPGLVLVLKNQRQGRWVVDGTAKVDARGRFVFAARPRTAGMTLWLVVTASKSTRAIGASRILKIRALTSTWLDSAQRIASHNWDYGTGPVTADGVTYQHAVSIFNACNYGGTWWDEWTLDGRYTRFQATLAFADDAEKGASTTYRISVDGRTLKTGLIQIGESVPVALSVNKAVQLRLQLHNSKAGQPGCSDQPTGTEGWLVFGNAQLLG